MADIRAFRGYRYDQGRAGALSEVVAPPYDVVDAALQQQLYDASPYNAIRLELTKDDPADTEGQNKYARAAQTLSGWVFDEVIQQDSNRCLYVCEQTFEIEGHTYTRRGFMARVRLEEFGKGKIYPHEETMSGPKEDRLKLYRATGMNLSPVFGLYPDPKNEVYAHLDALLLKTLPREATDHLGVTTRLWPIFDEKVVSAICGAMVEKPVYIADGHHRYETGVKYRDEKVALAESNGDRPDPEAAYNFILMHLVSMGDPGLVILPTHRLVSGFPGLTAAKLKQILEPHFVVELEGAGAEAAQGMWEAIEYDGAQGMLGFHTAADDRWLVARFVNESLMTQLAEGHSDPWRELGVAVLHHAVLNHLLPDALGGFALGSTANCRYVHLVSEVEAALRAGECSLAVLVPPASMAHVELIAGNREKMPPKSTYFYPKLLTGLVFNSLKSN